MKLLTVFFIIFTIYALFNQKGILGNQLVKTYNIFPQDYKISSLNSYIDELRNKNDSKTLQNLLGQIGLTIVILIGYLILFLIEFIFIVKLTSVGGIISVIYLIFYIANILLVSFQTKKTNNKNTTIKEFINDFSKFKIKTFIVNLIDLAYYTYIFYLLFI